jgi:mannosyltransferase OCH1-like enzyme
MIPKIIHQTYKDNNLPEIYKLCQNQIKNLCKNYQYNFYTDNDMNSFIKENFFEYYECFNNLPRKIMKIDMFRYFLMYKYGGWYLDMDYYLVNSLNLPYLNNQKIILPCNRENNGGDERLLGNCIFASEPNHPYWKTLMDEMLNFDLSKDYKGDSVIISTTGPGLVTKMWLNSSYKDQIFIPNRILFHPPSTDLTNAKIVELKKLKSVGMHICTGLWRNNKL